MSVDLTLCCDNSDLTRPLLTGEVEPDGVNLSTVVEYPPKRHRKFSRAQPYDVSELCLASYVASRSDRDRYPFTAIPVFPSKRFRHSFFYKHVDADVDEPADLEGKRVGVQSWQTAANVWMRGIAKEHHDLDLEQVEWYRRRDDDVEMTVPDRFDIQPVPGAQDGDAIEEPRDMRELLFSGDLDAVMDPAGSLLHAVAESAEATFMFDDPLAAEQEYYKRTGIHPIMHVLAVREDVLEENPWVASSLFDAFRAARDRAIGRNNRPSYDMTMTWSHLHRIDQRSVMGPDADVWEYGLTERTRRELETFAKYAHDQGLSPRQYEPEELFADEFFDG